MMEASTRQYIEIRVLLDRVRQEQASLILAIYTHRKYQQDPLSYVSSWKEYQAYVNCLQKAYTLSKTLEEELLDQLPK
jgi:hypothetical protein